MLQVTASVMLLLGVGAADPHLDRRFSRWTSGPPTAQVLTAEVQLPAATYPAPADVVRFFLRVDRGTGVGGPPGCRQRARRGCCRSAAQLATGRSPSRGRPYAPAENPNADYQAVTPGYFEAMGLRIVRGRGADRRRSRGRAAGGGGERDDGRALLARAGRHRPALHDGHRRQAVADHRRHRRGRCGTTPIVEAPRAEMYIAHAQLPGAHRIGAARHGPGGPRRASDAAVARAGAASGGARRSIRGWRWATCARWTIWRRPHVATARFTAAAAERRSPCWRRLLAAVGLYGAVSLVTDERAPEIGVRLALGAERGSILRLVLGEGVALTAIGAAIGLVAVGAGRAGHRRTALRRDPARPGHVRRRAAVVLRMVALLASLIPARRASRLDPVAVDPALTRLLIRSRPCARSRPGSSGRSRSGSSPWPPTGSAGKGRRSISSTPCGAATSRR